MRVLGIDPGAHGAIAVVDGSGLAELYDMPTTIVRRGERNVTEVNAAMLGALLGNLGAVHHAYIEQVGAMPGQGVSSMFAFGRALGVIEGVLGAFKVPVTKVPPQVWQRAVRVRAGGGNKDAARNRAMELYPGRVSDFHRKKDDGRADAALVATYGWLTQHSEVTAQELELAAL